MSYNTPRRVIASAVTLIVYFLTAGLYSSFKVSIEAATAVQQVQDSIVVYSFAQQMARGNIIPNLLGGLTIIALMLIWWKPFKSVLNSTGKTGATAIVALLLSSVMSTACGPAKVLPLDNVGPNETAFVIPMEGDSTKQAKFESVAFLQEHKVVSKRIEVPVRERSTGRMWWDYEWIPTVRVIKVDRSLVTREWTKGGNSGTSNKDEALSVASLDSINFHLGVNLTAYILEEEAPTYLYWHGQKKLEEVVDTNIRGYLQGVMSDEFGKLTLEQAKAKKAEIFKHANDVTIAKFKLVGITISYVGSAQGLMFDDGSIQAKINETQTAEMAVEVARKRNLEQIELNKAIVSMAVAKRQAAEEFAKASEAQKAFITLEIEKIRAEAMLAAANNLPKLSGQLPSVLPAGATLLFGLDGAPIKK